jgi:hypothetical protein
MAVGNLTLTVGVVGLLIFVLLTVVEIILLIFAYNNIKNSTASSDTNSMSAQSFIIGALVVCFLSVIIIIVVLVLGIRRSGFTKGLLYTAVFIAILADIIIAVLAITATNRLTSSTMYQTKDSLAIAAYEQLITADILVILCAIFVILILGVAVTRTDTEENVKQAAQIAHATKSTAALPAGTSVASSSTVRASVVGNPVTVTTTGQ